MNILITAPSLNTSQNVSGISTVAKNIIEHNSSHQYYHYLLGRPDKTLFKLVWLAALLRQILFFPFVLKREKIDLVHQNLPLDSKGVLRESFINSWCRLMRVPVVLHVHGGLFITRGTNNKLFNKLVRSLFSHSEQIIVLSLLEKERLKDNFNLSFSNVLSNSVDTSIFRLQEPKYLNEIPSILYLGRIEKNKGIIELIEALKLLHNDLSFKFILCGIGPLTEYCIVECNKFLYNNFQYKGVVSGDNKIETIMQSNFFVLPSYFEGLPMSLLETMAAGVVPVVTDVGSMKQIIKNGYNGLFVHKQNSQDLYEKLKIIISNFKLYNAISANAKKTVEEQYNITNYIVQLNHIYDLAYSLDDK